MFLSKVFTFFSLCAFSNASGCLSLLALIKSNSVLSKDPYKDEFVSPALCSSLVGAPASNHLSLQASDPQLPFVHRTSSSLFSTLIACERCPLWFCLHAKVLSGRECRKVSCVSVYLEDDGASYSPTEDPPPHNVSITSSEDINAICRTLWQRVGG